MRKNFFPMFIVTALVVFGACKKDTVISPDNTYKLTGTFVKQKSGTLVAQASTKTAGATELGTDGSGGAQVVHLGTDFNSDFGTGDVTVFLSKTQTYDATNAVLVSLVSKAGEQFFKVSPAVGNDYNYVIVYCAAAKEQFGYSTLTGVPVISPDNSYKLTGSFISQKKGPITPAANPKTVGSAELGTDGQGGVPVVHLGSDFASEFVTGDLTLFLSKTKDYDAASAILVSLVSKGGENYFKVPSAVTSDYNYLIVYCLVAKASFGYAALASVPVISADNSYKLTGSFIRQKNGPITPAANPKTVGSAELGTDGQGGVQVVHLGSDFASEFVTGDLTVFLSKTKDYDPTSAILVSLVSKGGENYFKVNSAVTSDYNYLLVYCLVAKANFGYAALANNNSPDNTYALTSSFKWTAGGSITPGASPKTVGTAELGTDGTSGPQVLHLGKDFVSDFVTGDLTLFLSKTANYDAAQVQLVSLVSKNGEAYYKVSPTVSAAYKYLIVYCAVAKAQFGAAELKTTPTGFTKVTSGSLVAQAAPQTKGSIEFGTDPSGAQWLHVSSDFATDFGTGAVTLYMSKTNTFATTSVVKVSLDNVAGEGYFRLATSVVATDYPYVIVYCDAAKVQFGYAQLK